MSHSPQPPSYPSVLRPSERVLRFLEDEIFNSEKGQTENLRLPTIKEIATHLNVGTSTVQTVFAQLARQNRIVTIPGKGTFLKSPAPSKPSSPQTISVLIHEPELLGSKSTWGKEICAGILRETSGKSTVQTFFSDIHGNDATAIHRETESSKAAIAFPSILNNQVAAEFKKLGKPVIHITPEHFNTTSNFAGPDFYQIAYKIASCWKQCNRKNIVILFHHSLHEGSTCPLSLIGFQTAVHPSDQSGIKLNYYTVNPHENKESTIYYLEFLFRKKPWPDAIYTAGDMIAYYTIDWLLSQGIRIPEDVSVIGGTGLITPYNTPILCTTIQQPFEEIGRTAAKMAIQAIKKNSLDQPGRFIPASIRIGRTTSEQENLLLAQI